MRGSAVLSKHDAGSSESPKVAALPFLRKCCWLAAILTVVSSLLGANLRAQTPERLMASIENTRTVRIEHSTHPLAVRANELARVEAGKALQRMVLVLWPSAAQEEELKKLLDDQQNRNSPNYHHWLTPAEFGQRFGMADADIQKVREWLERSGLRVGQVAASKRWVEFNGSSQQVESAFQTEMHYYASAGRQYVANATDISLPEALASVSRGVLSLNNFGRRPPRHVFGGVAGVDAQGHKVKLRASLTAAGQVNTFYLAPGDFAAIYNTKALMSGGTDGSGISIAVTAQSQIELSDVQMFRQIFGLKANDPNILLSGPDPGISNPTDLAEAQLDVEWAGAVAPGATIDLVVAGTTDTTNGVDLAAAYAIDNQVAPILTYTYASCEAALGTSGNAFYNALWQQAAAEGITVLVATGDNGAAGCDNANFAFPAGSGFTVNGAASTPYNVAVGGTQFNEPGSLATFWNSTNNADFSSAVGYIPEAAWNESCDPGQPVGATNCAFGGSNASFLAGGGGASEIYAKPAWQTGMGVPTDGKRDVPDVALAAASGHDDFVYCTSVGGAACQLNAQQEVVGLTLVGGTSVATPSMAGILALVEQKNGAYQGQANFVFYKLAQQSRCDSSQELNPRLPSNCVFYDITTGNNGVPCTGGSPGCSSTQTNVNGMMVGQTAGAGYDLATGLGSVNAQNLANAWMSAGLLASQTQVQLSSMSFVHGTAITLTGSVAPQGGSGTPTGTVSLKTDGLGDTRDLIALVNGAFIATVKDLPGGQYNAFAHYGGDATYAGSDSGIVAVNVTPETSSTSVQLSGLQGGTVGYGQPLEVIVKVVGASGAGTATGNITILDGGTTVGTYGLSADGTVTIPTGGNSSFSFATGLHSLTATYTGDNSFSGSVSGVAAFSVARSSPFVVVGANATNVVTGQSFGVHAVVAGLGTAPATGTVQFTVDGAPVGSSATLQTGGFFGTLAQTSAFVPSLTQGTHIIGASYNSGGDPNYLSVASGDPQNEATFSLSVGVGAGNQSSTTGLTATTLPVHIGDTGTFKVNVTPTTATGTVTLWDAVGPRSSAAPISGGTATIQVAWPQAGSTVLYAAYSGDATFAASTSAGLKFGVSQGVPQVALTVAPPSGTFQQTTLNVSVTRPPANSTLVQPTGTVEFWDALNGGAAQLLATRTLTVGASNAGVQGLRTKLASGTHSLFAHYRGDLNWQAANSPVVPLAAGDFAVSFVPDPVTITAGNSGSTMVTVTPSGGFTGTVNLSCPMAAPFELAGYSCTITPASVTITDTSGPVSATMNLAPVSTTMGGISAAKGATLWGVPGLGRIGFAAGLWLVAVLVWLLGKPDRAWRWSAASGVVALVAGLVMGCGGGGSSGGGGGPVATTTTISTAGQKLTSGPQVTVTVHSSANPQGQVTLTVDGQGFAGPVVSGVAQFNLSLPVGVHTLVAHYQGDVNNLPSSSANYTQIITGSTALQVQASTTTITHTATVSVNLN
jgi:Pro-kumamolisin, activation domain/Bacterial Ig-like domain (group 3)